MTLRAGHGKGAGRPHVEVLPPDELPNGVLGDVQNACTTERRPDGKFTKGARTHQSMGGKARANTTRLAERLGLSDLPWSSDFAAYQRAAVDFRRVHVTTLARTVGGGVCSAGPASIVASAALQLAISRYLFDRGAAVGDADMLAQASRIANDSRQNLLAAHELCAKEAQSRAARGDGAPDLAAIARQAEEETARRRDAERARRRSLPAAIDAEGAAASEGGGS